MKQFEAFCDGSAVQIKHFTTFRFVHWLVNTERRLRSIKVTFPERGHSYMECDKDMGLINQKAYVDVSSEESSYKRQQQWSLGVKGITTMESGSKINYNNGVWE